MKLELCSAFDPEEIKWTSTRELDYIFGKDRINLGGIPNKKILSIMFQIEQGNFPVLFLNDHAEIHAKHAPILEAYFRCRISVLPVIYKEVENEYANNDSVF